MCSDLALKTFHEPHRCDDGNAATTNDICASGACQGCPIVTTVCDSGTWDMSIGQCSATLPPDGTTCDSETSHKFGAALKHQTFCPKSINPSLWIFRESYGASGCVQLWPSHLHEPHRCDDGNAATTNDMCASGTCQGCPIVTTACDSGTWDMSIRQCSATLPPDGTMCDSETTNIFDVRHPGTRTCVIICESIDVENSSISLEQQMSSGL